MSIEAIEREIETWNEEQLRRLTMRIAALRRRQNPARAAELARLIDDKTPGHWLTLEEVDRRLSALPDQE